MQRYNKGELTRAEKEDMEKGRVAYALELGTLLDKGIKAFGVEWVTGLLFIVENRIRKRNQEKGIFSGIGNLFKGLFK
jgi:hypothetical protein